MKKWNAPEIAELNVTETKNGFWPSQTEFWFVSNDSLSDGKNNPNATPNPDNENEITNQLS